MEEISCPRCRTTKYRNPQLKLMISSCGHSICENCVDQLFVKGSGNCPVCDAKVHKGKYRYQTFLNSAVEKEVNIRKDVLKVFNKKEEDFSSRREYNDYLERVETIIFNLANDIDVDATKRSIETYRKENEESIIKNQSKKSKDEELIDELIENEKLIQEYRKQNGLVNVLENREQTLNRLKNEEKEQLIDKLMNASDAQDASKIVEDHTRKSSRRIAQQQKIQKEQEEKELLTVQQILKSKTAAGKFSSGINFKFGFRTDDDMDMSLEDEDPDEPYVYEEEIIILNGPIVPSAEELVQQGYLKHVRPADKSDRASGFTSLFPCRRALQEAFCGLFLNPEAGRDPDEETTGEDSSRNKDAASLEDEFASDVSD